MAQTLISVFWLEMHAGTHGLGTGLQQFSQDQFRQKNPPCCLKATWGIPVQFSVKLELPAVAAQFQREENTSCSESCDGDKQ